jgi:nicotinate-nucleotide adenylyltransferase
MKTGIFGGTFNPIHIAHLRIAEEIRDTLGLARVIFVPASVPPHKELADNLPFEHRFRMVELAIGTNPHFTVSDIEAKREGKSYSIDTIRRFRRLYPDDEFYFIMGSDTFVDFGSWKQYGAIFCCCNIVAITRPGAVVPHLVEALPVDVAGEFCYYENENRLSHTSGNSVFYVAGTQLDVSSTCLRDMIKAGRSVRYLVSDEVEKYIKEQRLYLNGN